MILFTFNIIFAADLTFFSSSSMSFWNCCCFRSENTVCIFQSLCVSLLFCCVGVGGDDRVVFMDHSCLGFSPKPVPPFSSLSFRFYLIRKKLMFRLCGGTVDPIHMLCVCSTTSCYVLLMFYTIIYLDRFYIIQRHQIAFFFQSHCFLI